MPTEITILTADQQAVLANPCDADDYPYQVARGLLKMKFLKSDGPNFVITDKGKSAWVMSVSV